MGSFFGEVQEPSTRALITDCSDEELISDEPNLRLAWREEYQKDLQFKKFLLIDGYVSLAFAEAYLLDSSHALVGNIIFERYQPFDDFYSGQNFVRSPLVLQDDCLICFVSPLLSPKAAFHFAELVSSICRSVDEVELVTTQSLHKYQQVALCDSPASAVFSLTTRSYKSTPRAPRDSPANILTGISAAVASLCEVGNIPAAVYVYYCESDHLDSISAQPLLGLFAPRQKEPDLKRRWQYGGVSRHIATLSNMYM